jgi:hypothetical protein
LPTGRFAVLRVAVPLLSVPPARVVPPSSRATLPPGVPLPGVTTLTDTPRVSASPADIGFRLALTERLVLAGLTCKLAGAEVLPPNGLLPA